MTWAAFEHGTAVRLAQLLRRLEHKSVNEEATPPRPRDESSYVVRVDVTSDTPTGGLYPCGWTWYDLSAGDWVSGGSAYAIPANGTSLVVGGGLGLLVGQAADGLCIFAVGQGAGSVELSEVDIPWSWTLVQDGDGTCHVQVATVKTLTGNFSIGEEHTP